MSFDNQISMSVLMDELQVLITLWGEQSAEWHKHVVGLQISWINYNIDLSLYLYEWKHTDAIWGEQSAEWHEHES